MLCFWLFGGRVYGFTCVSGFVNLCVLDLCLIVCLWFCNLLCFDDLLSVTWCFVCSFWLCLLMF